MRIAAALLVLCLAGTAAAEEADVVSARLIAPTDRYDHGVLGDAIEWGGLELALRRCAGCAQLDRVRVTLPKSRVFEDVEARVVDLDGDGRSEVLVVETDVSRGASLAVYGAGGLITATPFIGQAHRWLAPAGVGDLDGDGLPEIAYVDRPHLKRELVIMRYRAGALTEVARILGLTNHRIGDAFISGGMRNCGQGDEVILTDADWTRLIAVRLEGGRAVVRDIGPLARDRDFSAALGCQD